MPDNAQLDGFASRACGRLTAEDPVLAQLLSRERAKQVGTLNLLASSGLAYPSVLACLGLTAANVTAAGYPGKRIHSGCGVVDEVEALAVERAKTLFRARYANVQPVSGTLANYIVYFAFLEPGDTLLAMSLDDGGHLTHGAPLSISGKLFRVVTYGIDRRGFLDYDSIRRLAREHRPRLIVAGASSYPRKIDFEEFRRIADEVEAYLLADISHVAGLVAVGLHPDPIDHAHVTTLSTYKQLMGPRGGIILSGKDAASPAKAGGGTIAERLDRGTFPLVQSTPDFGSIAAKAHALALAATSYFRKVAAAIVETADHIAREMSAQGYPLLTGGTDNHTVMVDLAPTAKSDLLIQQALEECGILINRSLLHGAPKGAILGNGIRLGTNVLGAREMTGPAAARCAELVHRCIAALEPAGETRYRLPEATKRALKGEVGELCAAFPLPGYGPGPE